MSTAVASTGFSQEAFDAFLGVRDEPAWLIDMRRQAWRRFQDLPMPSVREEEWMRTDIRLFKLDRFRLPESAVAEDSSGTELPHALLAAGVDLGGHFSTLDSRSTQGDLGDKWRRAGVLFGSLD